MHLGFSYTGLIFLIMLFVPNIFWTRYKPRGYEKYEGNENRILLLLERTGEVLVSTLLLIFSDFNVRGLSPWLIWLAAAFVLMILYEAFWIRYFLSERTMLDFYTSFARVPVAGATLPVAAVILTAIYGGNPFLLIAGLILGTGHIGIHLQHRREVLEDQE